MKCRLNNGSAAKGDRVIPYDGVSLGGFASVEANFTMWVGSSDEASDLGKVRIRSATSSQFVVSENSNVSWQDDAWLTVIRYVELWAVYPRIVGDPSDPENVIFYKDWDLSYSNQNSILGSFPNAGSHQALFKGESVYYSNTGTVNLLGDTLNHNWAFEGGTPTGSSSATPGLVTYNTPGHYVTRYMVSGSSGGVDTTYRYISVYDRPGQGNSPPVLSWEFVSLGGSREEGGYTATIRVHENIEIDENSVIVLFGEDWYGSTKGLGLNNERIFFVGHVLQNSIRKNYQHSSIEFTVGSVTEIMKQAVGFAISVESRTPATAWFEIPTITQRKAIYHYLKWHTTALNIADFQVLGDDRNLQFFDTDRTSIFDSIDSLMRNSIMGTVVSNRQGKVWIETDARVYSNPTGSFASAMEITKRDWMGEPTIQQEFSDKNSYYEIGGIAYSGDATGTFSALLSAAPGATPSFRGSIELPDGYAILGQDQLNQMAGNIWANLNSRIPRINMELSGNYKNFDIAPQESAQMTILESDTVARIPVNGLYLPNNMEWRYDSRNEKLLANVEWLNLVSGEAGETVVIPTAEEVGDGGFNVPGLQIPPLPPLAFPPFALGSTTGSSCCDALLGLGLGMGVYSGLFTRAADTPPTPNLGEGIAIAWEYASNPSMYDASNSRILWLNTGTVSYEVELTATWEQTASTEETNENAEFHLFSSTGSGEAGQGGGGRVIRLVVGCPNYSGSDADDISSGVGDSGTIVKILTLTGNYPFSPNYMTAFVHGNSSAIDFKVVWRNIRFTIVGTS